MARRRRGGYAYTPTPAGITVHLLEYGSIGSHAALFTREMGLPCISELPYLLATVPDGEFALVDADTGVVSIRPQSHRQSKFILGDTAHCRS